MLLVHAMLRREFKLLPAAIRGVPSGDTERAAAVAAHTTMVYAVMAAHHRGTETHIWPLLASRVAGSLAPLAGKAQELSRRIDSAEGSLLTALDEWERDAGAARRAELASAVSRLGEVLAEYLDVERKELLPLAGEHITQAEWSAMIAEGMSSFTKEQLPVVLGATIYAGSAEAVELTMAQLPAGIREVMRQVATEAYERQAELIHGTATPMP